MMARIRYAAACARAIDAAKALVLALYEMSEAGSEAGDQGEGETVAAAIQEIFTGAASSLPGFADVFPRRSE